MAILNKIRQRSLILILVIALALFAFVIQGVIDNPNAFSDTQGIVATVNGESIDRNDFQLKVKNYQDRVGGRVSATQAMNTIYNEELRRIIMNNEYEALGLSVERDEMRDLLKNSFQSYPEFQDENGIFDVNRLNAFISNLSDLKGDTAPLGNFLVNYESWSNNEQTIANNAMQQSYYSLIKAGLGTTVNEAKEEYLADAKNVDIRYVQVPYNSIPDSLVAVTKSDVKAYMKTKKDQFDVEASREVVYVEFKEEASKADEDAIKAELTRLMADREVYNESSGNNEIELGFTNTKDISEFVNANSDIKYNDTYLRAAQLPAAVKDSLMALNTGAYYGPYKDGEFFKLSKLVAEARMPDTVKVRHILVPYVGGQRADATVTKTPEEAKATADSILAKIKSGQKFMNLLALSSDKVSNENNGELEFAYNAGMAPEFKAFSFENKIGDIDVIETSFGYHVIEILEQQSFNKTIKIATIARKIEPSDQTLQDVFNTMSKFEIAAKDGDFSALAKERELAVRPITFKVLDENIPALGSQRQVVRWAFDETTDTDDYKNFPISGFGFIVAKLVKKNEAGEMNIEDASVIAAPEIRKEKKAQLIRQNITATAINDIAKNQGQSPKTAAAITLKNTTLAGAGVEPKVVGAAFGLDEGQVSKPIDGEKGVYVVEVTKITEAQDLENYTAIMNRMNTGLRSAAQAKVYQALEKAADVEDNRKSVY